MICIKSGFTEDYVKRFVCYFLGVSNIEDLFPLFQ